MNNTHSKYNILIVDDEEGIREILLDIVSELGYHVIGVENGKEALDYFKNKKTTFDLIITDLKMPEMDGIALVKEIRAMKDIKQPAIVFSSGGVEEGREAELGIDGRLSKPFSREQIEAIVKDCFAKRKAA